MDRMVNFDNAATTFPKPEIVNAAVAYAIRRYGGNPGRSGHSLSSETADAVYLSRKKTASFFGAEPENVVFTLNCTEALNFVIKGALPDFRGHIVISDNEHNSVVRPVFSLSKRGARYSSFHIYPDDEKTVASFSNALRPDTRLVVCTAASNVTGQMPPIERIAEICRRRNIRFAVDAAQAAGVIPLEAGKGINFICAPGHKGLYGPMGTGILVSDGKYPLSPIMEGGTGSMSMVFEQPSFMPDSLESGTVNVIGIYALSKGIDFVSEKGIENIRLHEEKLCQMFIDRASEIPEIKIYREKEGKYAPIVSFNVKGFTSGEIASMLSAEGFCLRGGLHCAGMTHTAIGTAPDGTVRFAPSVFNNANQVEELVHSLKKILKKP